MRLPWVYIPDDICGLCGRYLEWFRRILGFETYWFFPGKMADQHVSTVRASAKFREFWDMSTQCRVVGKTPALHCFRHKFIDKRMDLWMEDGSDFSNMMPYLSRHLGHKGPTETIYYYHARKESFQSIRKKDSLSGYVIPGEDGR